VTRKQISSALDRFLGGTTTEAIIRELHSSIVRTRLARQQPRRLVTTPIRDFVDTLTRRNMTEAVLKRVRVAVAKAQRMR